MKSSVAPSRTRWIRSVAVFVVALTATFLAIAGPIHAVARPQQTAVQESAFADSVARELHARAVANWDRVDESLSSYAARIEQRMAAAVRIGMKDRVVYRNETALRVLWQRNGPQVTQVLGNRTRYPGRGPSTRSLRWLRDMPFDEPFDPSGDRLLFGLARDMPASGDPDGRARTEIRNLGVVGPSDEFWFAHPLTPSADADYRFRSGDTLTLSYGDGGRLSAVQLDVLPREADPHLISGTLWIEPGSGALVRAVYRLARPLDMMRDAPEPEPGELGPPPIPPMLRPLTMDVAFVSVSYSVWEGDVWLPQAMRMEAEIRMGALKFPVAFEMSYRIESAVVGPGEAADVSSAFIARSLEGDEGVSYEVVERTASPSRPESMTIVPTDPGVGERSAHLPPPIWNQATGFQTGDEVEEFLSALAALPAAPPAVATGRWTLDWPWTREGLLRYNRVEGLAAASRIAALLGRQFSLVATGRLGLADLAPKARVEIERSTVLRRLSAAAYHELRATDAAGDYLDLGNSARAFLVGRDYGDYYRATGAEFGWRPSAVAPESFGLRVYGERQTTVETEAGFALFRAFSDDWSFRPNPVVDEIEEAGAELSLSPWWGADPASAQFGLELYAQGAVWRASDSGAPGHRDRQDDPDRYIRASAVVRAVLPLFGDVDAPWRLGVAAGAGTAWGRPPVQRAWPLGGPGTLRGFDPGALSGTTFVRGRLELGRTAGHLGNVIFGDAGWAGGRRALEVDEVLYSVGFGFTIVDGLVRVDLARAVNGPDPRIRLHVHLDAIM